MMKTKPISEAEKKVIAFAEAKAEAQGNDKAFVDFSRFTFWDGEPCQFCGSKEGIREVKGRYISCDWDEEFEAIEGSQVYFCGDCLNLLEKHCETSME